MPASVNCRDIGADCDHALLGSSMDELLEDAANHAMEHHGCTPDTVGSAEWLEQMRAVIRNVSRPAHLRASSPPIPPYR